MNEISLITGASFGALAIIFGAFGAHALKKTLNETQLKNNYTITTDYLQNVIDTSSFSAKFKINF